MKRTIFLNLAVVGLLLALGSTGCGGKAPGHLTHIPPPKVVEVPAQPQPNPAVTTIPAPPPVAPTQPVTQPPVTQPPVTQPPVTPAPVTPQPVAQPTPEPQPPVTPPPVAPPPVTQPPVAQPPPTVPPVTQPPVAQPPPTVPPGTTAGPDDGTRGQNVAKPVELTPATPTPTTPTPVEPIQPTPEPVPPPPPPLVETPSGFPAEGGPVYENMLMDTNYFTGQTVYFDFDSSTVKADQRAKLEAVGDELKGKPACRVLIDGHCDERGTEEYNRSLGERRALSMREYLIRYGIAQDRVGTRTWGEDRPADLGHDDAAWAKNRRGEFILLLPKD